MKEEELKYLLRLLNELNAVVFDEFLKIYYESEETPCSNPLSENIINFLRDNFRSNPVTTSTVVKYLQTVIQRSEVRRIQNLYLEAIDEEISNNKCIHRLITFISLLKLEDEFLPTFQERLSKFVSADSMREHRKQMLLSLLPQERPELLKTTSELMCKNEIQAQFKLTPEYMLELCYTNKKHWLLKAAEIYKCQLQDIKKVSFRINNFTKQILIMVLIELANSAETFDLASLVQQLTNTFSILDTYTTADEQLQYYMTEVKRELTIIKFCLEHNSRLMTTSVFDQLLNQSALAVIAKLCNLSKVDRFKVSRLLSANNDMLSELASLTGGGGRRPGVNWDTVTYNAYCAVTKVIDIVFASLECGDCDVGPALEDVRRLVASLQPLDAALEVLENLFACLFLRHEHFTSEQPAADAPGGTHSDCSYFYSKKQSKSPRRPSAGSGFMCGAETTQHVLNTIRLCLEAAGGEADAGAGEGAGAGARRRRLARSVHHALWKLQLVSTLPPDPAPTQVRLCLDYVEVDNSSEEEEETERRRRPRPRRRAPRAPDDPEQLMVASACSANGESAGAPRPGVDFISLMLATPHCLVALAVYHNDFAKANQIIEMFDLAEADIATEVAFTEQIRHLVAKLKNILHYKDPGASRELSKFSVVSTEVMSLVETFLASNRSPNSYDIIELAARHPHLQLYSHQNAPLINAVDILLSSGLDRELTYGLVNVVERKLAEVRATTDVAAVKKVNYVRFVEDIASVTFEILGSSEKSFDFADDICGLITDCRIPLKHKDFCKLNQLSRELRKSCEELADIVDLKDVSELDPNVLQRYHQIYMNVVAASDKDMCNIAEVGSGSRRARTLYLRMCYMYCKAISQLELSDNNSDDSVAEAPYFSVLNRPLYKIFGNLIRNKDVPVVSLEAICRKLNINLIPKLILNFCPPIRLAEPREASEAVFNNLLQAVYEFRNTEEKLFVEPKANFAPLPRAPDAPSLTYISLHNWVLAHIVRKVHAAEPAPAQTDARAQHINRFMELERFDVLKVLYDDNKYLASLHAAVDLDELFAFMCRLIECGKMKKCLDLIDALSERQLMGSANLLNLRDLVLMKLAMNPRVEANWRYCQHLRCAELKTDLVLNNLQCWAADGALRTLDYLRFLLDRADVEDGLYERCTEWMTKIPLYDKIASIMDTNHWYTVYEKSVQSPEEVIEILMESQQLKLCLEWADGHDVSANMRSLIVASLLRQLFEYPGQCCWRDVRRLLARLPATQAVQLVQKEMAGIRDVDVLQACVDFAAEHSTDYRTFENIKIGLQIILEIEPKARGYYWDLIEKPLLMIEQFLMNARLDDLFRIMNKIAPSLKRDPTGDNLYYNIKCIDSLVVSRNAVDGLLRYYAEKALDVRTARRSPPPRGESRDDLMQSLDSINLEAAAVPFAVPEQVPPREQWVADSASAACQVCRAAIFSMVIRRHHCRRCGRLACHACSRRRMEVPTYPAGVRLRVCDDCHAAGAARAADARSLSDAGSGEPAPDWRLSPDARRAAAVRREFNYEFTPDVALARAVLTAHSVSLDCARFLLDRSEELSRSAAGAEARMLLRARRSLLLAAADMYSAVGQSCGGSEDARVAEAGALHAARLLAHADAAAALLASCPARLLPHPMHPSHIVRSLLEAEKWEPALEIATKAGLSRAGVLAAWGKACLKAGCFRRARDKFAHCFKSTPLIVASCVEDCEFGREAAESRPRRASDASAPPAAGADARPRADPPLLAEIVTLLEDMNYPVSPQLLSKAESIMSTNEKLSALHAKKRITVTEPALNIMHTLASVKKIRGGDYSDFHVPAAPPRKSLLRRNHQEPKPDYLHKKLDPFFYKECVYYLSNYGSHAGNIAFHMRHSSLAQVLGYCQRGRVEREVFTDTVFLECLKKDRMDELIKCMGDVDGTLEVWGDYILHACGALQSARRLPALYRVQAATGQHARAAATAVRLYSAPVPSAAATPANSPNARTSLANSPNVRTTLVNSPNARATPANSLNQRATPANSPNSRTANVARPSPANVGEVVGPFTALHARRERLASAMQHLSHVVPTSGNSKPSTTSLHLQLDKPAIDKHMSTLARQAELARLLAACEAAGRVDAAMINEVVPLPAVDVRGGAVRPLTLFGSNADKIRLVALALVAGATVEEGFQLAFRIITEHKLDSMSVYTHVARWLVRRGRFLEVKTLAAAIRASNETAASLMSDQVLETGVQSVVAQCEARGQLHDEMAELLIDDVRSVSIKISCYISCRILSAAYILAARRERSDDLRRVLQEAERLGNDQIRSACVKRLTGKAAPAPPPP